MTDFRFLLLHVQDPAASAAFYHALLNIPIVDQQCDFAMLPLRDGVMLGLWARTAVADAANVVMMHDDWQRRGVTIAQSPTQMVFGMTFVGVDPDGHRLRVFAAPAA